MRHTATYLSALTLCLGCTGVSVVGGPTPDDAAAVDLPQPEDRTTSMDAPDVAFDTAPDVAPDGVAVDAPEVSTGCASDAMCVGSAGGPVCDVATGRCVGCLPSRDTCPATQHCDTGSMRCLDGCRNDEGCASATDAGAASLHCDTTTRACVACVTDAHCPPGTLCVGAQCVTGCSPSRACPEGRACCDGACVDTQSNVAACGACAARCAFDHAAPACMNGVCAIASCTAPYANCDGDPANGCEADTTRDVNHCGICRFSCGSRPHATASCAAGACEFRCDEGYADCDADPANGCESSTQTDVAHCGACATRCDLPNATASCAAGRCAVAACAGRALDCDGSAVNGCEVDGDTAVSHCGRCDVACATPAGAAPTCVAGRCGFVCLPGMADCDGDPANGCEVDTRATSRHCGACGRACSATGTAATRCEASVCAPTCATGRGDCDGDPSDGCESTVTADAANCGMCGRACAAGQTCVAGVCTDPLPVSCAALLRRAPSTPDGMYAIAPVGGAAVTAYCDMATGRGYTFLPGRSATDSAADILAACPAGTAAYEVRSEAHAAALRRYVRRASSTGQWYWANHFTGPTSTCPALATRTGWLRAATDWVDASIRAEFLAPLDVHENCNLEGVYDPVPLNDRDGFANRDCAAPCAVLYNARERALSGTVVCSVNDVPACPAGYDDCDGGAANGCEAHTAVDVGNCGRCGQRCDSGLVCGAGVCVRSAPGPVYTPPPPPVPTGAPTVMATGISGPQGMAIAADGAVFVSALVAGTIVRIDPSTTPGIVSTWATGFSEPAQLAFEPGGALLVAERTGNRLTRVAVNADGSAGARSTVATGFSGPWGVTVEAAGTCLVSNEFGAGVDRVALATGAVTRDVITGYNAPLDMRFDATSRLLVGQYFGTALNNGALVHRYDASLTLRRSTTGFSGPIGIALDAAGNAYVANWDGGVTGAGRVLRLADDGTVTVFYGGLNGPHAIAFDARGGLWVNDYQTNRVLRLGGS